MRKIREVLRLYFAAALSIRAIARSLGTRRRRWATTCAARRWRGWVGPCRSRSTIPAWSAGCFRCRRRSRTARPRPDWSEVHRELRRRSVTLSLLWQEHKETHPEGLGSEVRPGGAPGAPRRREAVRRLRRADGAGGRPRDRRDAAGKLPGSRRSQFEQATPRLVEAQVGVDRAARRARFAGRVEPPGFHQPDTFTLALPLQQREKAARRGFRRARANPPPTRSHRAQSVGRTGRVVESRSPHPNRHHTRLTPRSSA